MRKELTLFCWLSAILLASETLLAQKPKFEVVSIKPSAPGSSFSGGGVDGNRYVMRGATLKILLQIAYKTSKTAVLREDQVLGGPVWIDSDHFDVEAKAGCARGAISDDQLQLMAQSILEDRFQLRAHYETRDLPVYDLVVAKGGLRMKMSHDQTPAVRPAEMTTPPLCAPDPPAADRAAGPPTINSHSIPRGMLLVMRNASEVNMTGTGVPIADLVQMLQGQAGRWIIDKTGMNELFDINLKFSRQSSSTPEARNSPAQSGAGQPATVESDVPELFTAIQEQLGLRLESAKAALDVLVIDSVQKPSEN